MQAKADHPRRFLTLGARPNGARSVTACGRVARMLAARMLAARMLAAWMLAAWMLAGTTEALGQEPKTYVAMYTNSAPVIDGILTGDREWDAAESGGDDWRIFASGVPDPYQNRFAMLWDEAGLYVQHQVDYLAWKNQGHTWELQYENLNLFFDPNTDSEANENTEFFGYSTDGYQLAINQPLGESEISPSAVTAGMFADAYVNNLFISGSAGPYSAFSGIVMKQNTSVVDQFGYLELFIPWTDFDATDPNDGFDPVLDDVGLYHPAPPTDGEEWYFNVARMQSNGSWPAWDSPSDADFLRERPHGLLRFARGNADPCDVDGDGDCDADDIDAISLAVLGGVAELRLDFNEDGDVTDADRVFYVEQLLESWIGDANLDREFNTADLVTAFQEGGYEDGIPGNAGWASGDWSGDLDFDTSDFVAAFQAGGFELGPRVPPAAAAVPEPTSSILLALGLGSVLLGTARRR